MAIYVDPLFEATPRTARARSHGRSWCHMFTDGTPEELHALAARIGLRRSYAQHDGIDWRLHYDLTPSRRAAAIRAGAVEATYQRMREIALKRSE